MFLGAASTSVNRFLSIHLKHFPSKMATLCASSSYLSNDFHQFAFRSFFCCFFLCLLFDFRRTFFVHQNANILKKNLFLVFNKKKKRIGNRTMSLTNANIQKNIQIFPVKTSWIVVAMSKTKYLIFSLFDFSTNIFLFCVATFYFQTGKKKCSEW